MKVDLRNKSVYVILWVGQGNYWDPVDKLDVDDYKTLYIISNYCDNVLNRIVFVWFRALDLASPPPSDKSCWDKFLRSCRFQMLAVWLTNLTD